MIPEEFIQKSKELVSEYENTRIEQQVQSTVKGMIDGVKWDRAKVKPTDVYIVWWSKTLKNAKALLSTPRANGMYYEVTLDGEKNKIYFDAYKKENNTSIDIKGGE